MILILGYSLVSAAWLGSTPTAGDGVALSSDVESGAISQDFNGGDIVSISLFLEQDSDAALFGAELVVEVASSDLLVRSVAFSRSLSEALGDDSAVLPGRRFTATRTQQLRAINRSLGTNGAPIHFATVELEVVDGQGFESALIVKARGALVGRLPESTTVLGNPSRGNGWGEGRIEIVNTRPPDPSLGTPMQPQSVDRTPWTVQQTAASLQVRPVSGLLPVTVLAPNTAYEIHYAAGASANGFDLVITADSAESGPEVDPAGTESWDGLSIMDLSSADAAEGTPVRQAISGDLLDATGNSERGSGNLLCNFTTGAAGSVTFDLRLYDIAPAQRLTVEMPATAEFTVE